MYKAEGWSCVWCMLDFGGEDHHVWHCFFSSIFHARIIWDIFNPTLLVPNLKRTCRKNKIVFMICSWLQCWFSVRSVSPMDEVFAVMLQGESGQLFKLQMLWRDLSEVARLSIHFLDFISHCITLTSSVLGHGWFMPGTAYFCFRSSGYAKDDLLAGWGPPTLWGWYIHSGWEGAKGMPAAGIWTNIRIMHRFHLQGSCRNVSGNTDGRKSEKVVMRAMR